jgi:hypothetical protein
MKLTRIFALFAASFMAVAAAGSCGRTGYEDFVIPEQGDSDLRPVSDIYMYSSYEGKAPTKEKTNRTVRSSDGLCVIECKDSYYDVTLDYEKGSHYDVGSAYAEAIMLAYDDYPEFCEGYLFENIKAAFSELNGDYSGIKSRSDRFYSALPGDYRAEIDGFAGRMCDDTVGIAEDGTLSRDEAVLMQLIPDVLRGTACSAVSADVSTTATGERITCRVLEWQLGSDNQICSFHALVHVKNGEKSFVSVSNLGFMTILTAVNNDGVMLGELDVGSKNMVKYTCENKTSYTYGLRYALESFTTAREAAEYLVENAPHYAYCINVLATDRKDAFVAELCADGSEGTSLIRDSSTPLNEGLVWEDPNYLCAVNSFAAKGNSDQILHMKSNMIRWNRYNELFCGEKQLTVDRLKELMTCERIDNDLARIRSEGLVHIVIADYSTERLQAVLTGTDGIVQTPEFIDLGSWR